MAQLFANNAATTLSASAQANDTVLAITSTASFPTLAAGDYFLLTLVELTDGRETYWEIVKATAFDTTTVTVGRAQEGTTARFWTGGTKVELRLTAKVMTDLQALEALVYAGL
jgi:hypothetical protein